MRKTYEYSLHPSNTGIWGYRNTKCLRQQQDHVCYPSSWWRYIQHLCEGCLHAPWTLALLVEDSLVFCSTQGTSRRQTGDIFDREINGERIYGRKDVSDNKISKAHRVKAHRFNTTLLDYSTKPGEHMFPSAPEWAQCLLKAVTRTIHQKFLGKCIQPCCEKLSLIINIFPFLKQAAMDSVCFVSKVLGTGESRHSVCPKGRLNQLALSPHLTRTAEFHDRFLSRNFSPSLPRIQGAADDQRALGRGRTKACYLWADTSRPSRLHCQFSFIIFHRLGFAAMLISIHSWLSTIAWYCGKMKIQAETQLHVRQQPKTHLFRQACENLNLHAKTVYFWSFKYL